MNDLSKKPRLSVIVNFHNMNREAPRTLHALSGAYQRGVSVEDYEVIAVDNGSPTPLDPAQVEAHGTNFRLLRVDNDSPSPCAAINQAVRQARGAYVMVNIDGARILSPGVLRYALEALELSPHPFVYTLGMHLGPKVQNDSILDGYCQEVEDALLDSVDWKADGYQLFQVSSVALSSRKGFFSLFSESNCFALNVTDWADLGGFDERFSSAGGGLVNLDFFSRVHENPDIRPVILLGEATFHQFHGGVATNAPRSEHPWHRMAEEYRTIRGKPFVSTVRKPEYFGWLSPGYHAKLGSL